MLLGWGLWDQYKYIKALGVSLGMEMGETKEDFMAAQREKYGAELARLQVEGQEERKGHVN
jgi:hypothetical protein